MHSIIITHRNRNAHLRLCLWSIGRSAELCGVRDYEIVIVDNGSDHPPEPGGPVRVVHDTTDMPVFSRAILNNRGIDAAGTVDRDGRPRPPRPDDVLTFQDADALVGTKWMLGAERLADQALTKVCYRVRKIRQETAEVLSSLWPPPDGLIKQLFRSWEIFSVMAETLGDGTARVYPASTAGRVYGNSMFSIRRGALGDVRYDEGFVGYGSEDLDLNRRIVRAHGQSYRAALDVSPEFGHFLLMHDYEPEYYTQEYVDANHQRFVDAATADGDEEVLANLEAEGETEG